MKGFIISGIPELFILSLAFILGDSGRLISILAAALLHELGHVTAAVLLGVRLRFCRTGISGVSLKYDFSLTSPLKESGICLAGPVAGLMGAYICYLHGSMSYFAGASLALALFNLLPISYLDGGCILSATLSMLLPPNTVWHICRTLSIIFTLVLWCGAVFIMLRTNGDISVMSVTMYLLYRLFSE